jgi:YfiH family protein
LSGSNFLYPDWPAPQHIKALVTCRNGGFSQPPYDSFNLAQHVGDDAAVVIKNRQLLPNSYNFSWLTQTHSTICVDWDDVQDPSSEQIEADASTTRTTNKVCVVMTADCLPILLCDLAGTQVAAVHAGWRGLADGIVENTVGKIKDKPQNLIAWMGPAISQANFEVGEDVKAKFNRYPEAFKSNTQNMDTKYFADLYYIAKQKLLAIGVSAVFGGNFCTYEQDDLFFSHRRATHQAGPNQTTAVNTGRMVTAIYIS